jgi:hypothetical protein
MAFNRARRWAVAAGVSPDKEVSSICGGIQQKGICKRSNSRRRWEDVDARMMSIGLTERVSSEENWLYSKDFFDKGAIRTYDARLC